MLGAGRRSRGALLYFRGEDGALAKRVPLVLSRPANVDRADASIELTALVSRCEVPGIPKARTTPGQSISARMASANRSLSPAAKLAISLYASLAVARAGLLSCWRPFGGMPYCSRAASLAQQRPVRGAAAAAR